MDEEREVLKNYLGKDDFTALSPPPTGSKITQENDDIYAKDDRVSIRIYPLNSGDWGYEMDVYIRDKKSDLTMRGELPEDFYKNPHGLKFHLFEVM